MTLELFSTPGEAEDFYKHIFDEMSEGVIGADQHGIIVLCNKAVGDIFGWQPQELVGQRLEVLIPQRLREAHTTHYSRFQEGSGKPIYMGKTGTAVRGLRKDGEEIYLGTSVMRSAASKNGALFIAVVRDISERAAYLREIERLANIEALTGLLNRRRFFEAIEQQCRDISETESVWLGLFDLDGFKAINDVYGHQTGDGVLKQVAEILRNSLPETSLMARMGGDEFAIALPGQYSAEDADKIGCRIVAAIREINDVEGAHVSVGASAGFARFPDMADNVRGLYERADFSLYQAKKARTGGINIYSSNYEAKIDQRTRIEHHLRTNNLEREMFLEYQPIIDLERNIVTHFEALARWTSPELGSISPAVFIPAAEGCGKIKDITRLLFQRALDEARTWPEHISLSFNLSAQDILSTDSIFQLMQCLLRSGVSPSRVEFEITETSILTDFEQATLSLNNLSMCGCRLALDDFGNGYSSYGYIDRLPLNKIKMDRSFVSRLASGNNPLKIIKAIADFAASMDLACVAEGVETLSQLKKIKAANVPFAQGYLFSRPMAPDAIARFLASGQPAIPRSRRSDAG